MHPREKYCIPNLRNACRVLKALADRSEGLELRQISTELEIPRTTTLRICTTLEMENLLTRNAAGRYLLGSSLAPIGMRALPEAWLRNLSVPILNNLVAATGETAHLAVLCGKKSLLLEVRDSPQILRVASRPGSLAQIHCSATGKVFLAHSIYIDLAKFLEGVELEKKTERTLTTIDALRDEVKRVRTLGYGVDDEEYTPGVRCMATPVRDSRNHVIAAVGITGAAVRVTVEKTDEYLKPLLEAAAQLSAKIIESQRTQDAHDSCPVS